MSGQIGWFALRRLYRHIGKAIWGLQYLEVALDQVITLKVDIQAPGRFTMEECLAKLERNQRNTLGVSLKKARQHQVLDDAMLARLEALNEERAWLVHRSLTKNGDDLYEDVGRKAVLQRVEAFAKEAHVLQHEVTLEVARFIEGFGYDVQAIGEEAEADLNLRRKGTGGTVFHDLRRRLTGERRK